MELVILVLGLIFNLLIFSLVLIKNPRRYVNRVVAAAAIALIAWEIPNFLSDKTSHFTLFWNRATFIGPMFILVFGQLFIVTLKNNRLSKKELSLTFLITAVFSGLALTPYVILSVHPRYNGDRLAGYNVNHGTLYPLLIAWLLFLIARFVTTLVITWKQAKGQLKLQLNIVIYGAVCAILLGVTTNLILPNLTESSSSSQFAPIASVIVLGSLTIAIFKHGLFDIELIIARSLAYVLSLVSLIAIFISSAFALTGFVFRNSSVSSERSIYTVLAIVLALLFPPLKRFFDRTTNRLFFRDSYDTQAFMDEFNQNLVAAYELEQLLKQSAVIIERNIKPTHCLFIINATSNTPSRVLDFGVRKHVPDDDLARISAEASRLRAKLIVTDDLEGRHQLLRDHMRAHDLVIAARMTASPSGTGPRHEVGYLLLGPKKSGNLYSSQDTKVLEIVANELVIAVQNALRFEEIESFNITLQAKVDEATKKLRKANERLRALDETKDDFISMASHQLRTPLTSVKGYVSMVLEGDTGKITPKQREMLDQAFFSSQRMVYLIADLLNVSRLKTGKFVIEPSPVNLAEVVDQELSQLKETATTKQLKLSYDKPKKFPELMLDETKTRQVIMNFVDNAIYYTPSGGQIKVRLVDSPGTVELRVEDNGIGVPASEKAHMFTKFYRAGNARKARPDGTGLGLFMAKKVIVAQGGAIIFESQEGKGSTFGFIFSKAKHAVPANAPTADKPAAESKK